jgi:hypothetical protein
VAMATPTLATATATETKGIATAAATKGTTATIKGIATAATKGTAMAETEGTATAITGYRKSNRYRGGAANKWRLVQKLLLFEIVRVHNVTFTSAAMRVRNKDRSPVLVHSSNTAPTPA